METIKVDSLVLGAGPSGLSTACRLNNKGEQFILLEGSERVGGNCFTFWENDFGFDSGAHRLHDKNEEVSGWIKGLLKKDLFREYSPFLNFRNHTQTTIFNGVFFKEKRFVFELIFFKK